MRSLNHQQFGAESQRTGVEIVLRARGPLEVTWDLIWPSALSLQKQRPREVKQLASKYMLKRNYPNKCHQTAATPLHVPLEGQSPGSEVNKGGTRKVYFNGKKDLSI